VFHLNQYLCLRAKYSGIIAPPERSERRPEPSDANEVIKQRFRHDTVSRRKMLKQTMCLGLTHAENKNASTTLLGHKIVLQNATASVAEVVESVENSLRDAVKNVPHVSIVMAGVALVLPLLASPAVGETDHQAAFMYITSQLRYYEAMERRLLPNATDPILNDNLSKRLVDYTEP
jgi:hypothetical protein